MGCTPGVVSGIDCTRSPIVNTAGEKRSTGGGKAAAAVKINKMDGNNELMLKRKMMELMKSGEMDVWMAARKAEFEAL